MAIDPEPYYEDVDRPIQTAGKTFGKPEPIPIEDMQTEPAYDYGSLCLTLHQWAKREIKPKDHLLGEVFNTTTRAILSAETGIGKTHLGFATMYDDGMAKALDGLTTVEEVLRVTRDT